LNYKALYISRKALYRHAVLLVPIISIFVVVVLTLFEAHKYRQFGRELVVTRKQVAQLDSLIKDLDAKPPITVIPVIRLSPSEQPDFIDLLRSRAEVNHTSLTRWANAAGSGSSPGAVSGGANPLPADVGAINCSIEVTGKYNDLRHFLYSLQDGPRLFTLSDMAWSRNGTWPITTLKFNLARYTTINGSAPVRMPPQIPTKATANSGKHDQVVVDTTLWKSGAHWLHPFPSTDNLTAGTKKVSETRGTQITQ
jgi:hypothetical protein